MKAQDVMIFRELRVIHQITHDEMWLEGERRGCRVSADDPVVRENVCLVVLRIGQQLRDLVQQAVDENPVATPRAERLSPCSGP